MHCKIITVLREIIVWLNINNYNKIAIIKLIINKIILVVKIINLNIKT